MIMVGFILTPSYAASLLHQFLKLFLYINVLTKIQPSLGL